MPLNVDKVGPSGGNLKGSERAMVLPEHFVGRVRLIDHTIDLLRTVQVVDESSRWFGGFRDPLRLVAEPWYAAGAVDVMVAALVEPQSRHFGSPSVAQTATIAMEYVRRNQYPNGTIDAYFVGDMQAACNVAFVSRMLARAYRKLQAAPTPVLGDGFMALLQGFLERAGAAMVARSAYTANHRWVITDALLQINELFPNPALYNRALAYLDEGIDINEDGIYSEWSTSYGMLSNETLISIGERTGDERYFEFVKRNLEFVLYVIQPNGEDAYQFSKRQDAVLPQMRLAGFDVFRWMAHRTKDGRFAAMADLLSRDLNSECVQRQIEREKAEWRTEIADSDVHFPSLKYSLVKGLAGRGKLLDAPAYLKLDSIKREPLPIHFHRFFPSIRLARIRNRDIAFTVMGMQANFFSVHAGELVIEGIRMKYLYHNWKSFVAASFSRTDDGYLLRGSHLSNPELHGKRKERMQREDEDLILEVCLTQLASRSWEMRVAIDGQPMVPIQLEIAVRPNCTVIAGEKLHQLPTDEYLFVAGSALLKSGRRSIQIDGLPDREHRFVDDRDEWLGNIPASSLYSTFFSPSEFTVRITIED